MRRYDMTIRTQLKKANLELIKWTSKRHLYVEHEGVEVRQIYGDIIIDARGLHTKEEILAVIDVDTNVMVIHAKEVEEVAEVEVKNDLMVLTGANETEIRTQLRTLEEQGMYFGRCLKKEVKGQLLVMIFKVENQYMNPTKYHDQLDKSTLMLLTIYKTKQMINYVYRNMEFTSDPHIHDYEVEEYDQGRYIKFSGCQSALNVFVSCNGDIIRKPRKLTGLQYSGGSDNLFNEYDIYGLAELVG